ncbi:MAG: phosphodiester glycosidase family protein [Clostridia bacterium]|nr:phosphodiester glycosidase family protein [Clostridia bacterium]MBP5270558.1 phosphodiester glycosidase family protein [Clostridia bacterium]
MNANRKRKAARPSALPKIAVMILIVAALLAAASFAALFVAARGPARDEARLLCATMVEKGFPLTDLFFTSSEIKNAKTVSGTIIAGEPVTREDYKRSAGGFEAIEGRNWKGYLLEFAPGASVSIRFSGDEPPAASAAVGLSSAYDAMLTGECLYYTVDAVADSFDFLAFGSDGSVSLTRTNASGAVNGGFVCGVSTPCVLIENGIPADGLGGGYGSRAAIGVRADGSLLLFEAVPSSVYPCGMTYGELASLMFEYGAETAVALAPAGAFARGGSVLCSAGGTAGPVLSVTGTAPAAP